MGSCIGCPVGEAVTTNQNLDHMGISQHAGLLLHVPAE